MGNHWIIVLARGEKIITSLIEFCNKKKIKSGAFNAIGAINEVEIAHFSPTTRKYHSKQMAGALEIVSLMGNITRLDKDNSVVIHSHISVSAEDLLCYGGHLKEATVAVTCEINITDLKTTILRTNDKEFGLNLIQ